MECFLPLHVKWARAIQVEDGELLWGLWCEAAEQYLVHRCGLSGAPANTVRKHCGRGAERDPVRNFQAAAQLPMQMGALDLQQRRLQKELGKLIELQRQWKNHVHPGPLRWEARRIWSNAQDMARLVGASDFPGKPW